MKKYLLILGASALLLSSSCATSNNGSSSADGLGALLSGGKGSGTAGDILTGLGGVVEGLMTNRNLTERDLVGNWRYAGPAVEFRTTDMLKKAGGAAAAKVVENKLAPYYKKVGFQSILVTVRPDRTFSMKLHRLTLEGTLEKAPNAPEGSDFIFTFKAAGGLIPVKQMLVHAERLGSKISLTVDASNMITLIDTVATLSGQETLQGVATLLNQFDGLYCGFELQATR